MIIDTLALMADELDGSVLKSATKAEVLGLLSTLETNGKLNFDYEVLTYGSETKIVAEANKWKESVRSLLVQDSGLTESEAAAIADALFRLARYNASNLPTEFVQSSSSSSSCSSSSSSSSCSSSSCSSWVSSSCSCSSSCSSWASSSCSSSSSESAIFGMAGFPPLNLEFDEADDRDFMLTATPDIQLSLPQVVTYKAQMSPVKNQGRLGCHDDQTEVLTESGWKLFESLECNEKVATVNPSGILEYQVPTALVSAYYEGKMHHFIHKSLDAMVTPNHRMYVRKWDEASKTLRNDYDFKRADEIGWYTGLMTNVAWEGKNDDVFHLNGVEIGPYGGNGGAYSHGFRDGVDIPMDKWVSFIGLYLAEGCVYSPEPGTYRVEIAGKKPEARSKIRILLDSLPFKVSVYPDRFTIHDKRLYTYLRPLGNVYTKHVPNFIHELSTNLLEQFLEWYCLGDGHKYENGSSMFYSVSKRLLDEVQVISLKCGKWSTLRFRESRSSVINGRVVKAENCSTSHELYQWSTSNLSIERKKQMSIVDYKGYVYCAEVPNSTLITRRNGIMLISGNSCVGFATAAMKEWQEQQEHMEEVKSGKDYTRDKAYYDLSEQWIYYNCKKIDPWPNSEGTSIRCAMKVLNKIGVPCEKAWPYDDIDVGEPEKWASLVARWNTIGSYWRIAGGVNGLRAALAEHGPIVVGMLCYNGIFTVGKDGKVPNPAVGESPIGGHAICVVAYNDKYKVFVFKNSWGTEWGNQGYGVINYDYAEKNFIDMWVAKDVAVTRDMLKGSVDLT